MSSLTSHIFGGKSDGWIRLIGAVKLLKAALLLALGLAVAALLDKSWAGHLRHWIAVLSLRQESRYLRTALAWFMGVNRRNLRLFEIGTFCYAGLLFTEGVGLLMLRRWAEWLTALITASFIPLELYGAVSHFSPRKTLVLFLNVAVVWYLSARAWNRSAESELINLNSESAGARRGTEA